MHWLLRSMGGGRFGGALLAIATALAMGCGASSDVALSERLLPPACDLTKLAKTLVGPFEACPPGEVIVQTESGTTRHRGQPSWNGEQACTRFVVEGDGCADLCAPALCWLDDETVECDSTCSADRTTCFVLPPTACPAP
ncbi:MAG TPA: hypothetical protein VGD74_03010 [Vulgatibacter sp.]